MFDIILEDSTIFIKFFKFVENIVKECILDISDQGLKIYNLTSDLTSFFSLFISRSDFLQYSYNKPIKINVNIKDMVKVFKRTSERWNVQISYDEKNIDELNIKLIEKETNYFRNFSIKPLYQLQPINIEHFENITFPNKIKIPFIKFEDIIADADEFSEILRFNLSENKLILSSIGIAGKTKTEFTKNFSFIEDFNYHDDVDNEYPVSKLKTLKSLKKFSTLITINIANNGPIKIELDLLKLSRFVYYIAPRAEDIDDNNDYFEIH